MHQTPLAEHHGRVKQHPHQRHHHHRGEVERGVELGIGLQLQVAQAAFGGHVFTDHRADHRQRHRHLEPAENIGQGRRQAHFPERLRLRGAHRAHQIHHRRLQRLQADHGRDHDREKRDQERQEDFWRPAVAEVQHQQGRQHDLRNGLQRDQERVDRALERPRVENRQRHRHADRDRTNEAGDDFKQGDVGVFDQQRKVADDPPRHLPGRRQDEFGESEQRHRDLPEHQEKQGQRWRGERLQHALGELATLGHYNTRFLRLSSPQAR